MPRVSKDILRLLIREYFDHTTVIKCLRINKFTRSCVTFEAQTAAERGCVRLKMERRVNIYVRAKTEERVKRELKGNKKLIKHWMSKPIVFCNVCETHMFEVDLNSHQCFPPTNSSWCDCCQM